MSGAATAGLWRLTLSGVGPKSMTGGIFNDAGVGEAYRGMIALSDPYVGGFRELGCRMRGLAGWTALVG